MIYVSRLSIYLSISICSILTIVSTAYAATVSLPGDSGGSVLIPTTSNTLQGTDIYTPPPITQEQAVNRDYPIGNTDLSDTPSGLTIEGILRNSSLLLNRLAPFIISLTLLTFLWGIFQLVRGGSEEAHKEGKQVILFGILGLFVMVSVWGLVNLLSRTTGLTGVHTAPQGPGVPRFK